LFEVGSGVFYKKEKFDVTVTNTLAFYGPKLITNVISGTMTILITNLLVMTILVTFNTGVNIDTTTILITNLLIITMLVTLNTGGITYNDITYILFYL
jgi:hypothetical protein